MGVPALRIFRSSVSISLALHLLFGAMFFFLLSKQPAVSPRHLTWIEVEPAVNPEALKKAQENFQTKNLVVQTEKAQKTEKAPPNAYLGEQNQVVDRESVSKSRTTVMGHASTPTNSHGETDRKAARRATKVVQAVPQVPVIGNLGVQIIPKHDNRNAASDEQLAHEENWADQGSSPEDYVKGVKESDRTALNTKEFIFYGYYQRIRQRLDNAWIPILKDRLVKYYNTGRHLASDMEHTTRVVVLLNQKGEITAVRVVSESGTHELDAAAVDAFNQAGPFPNPPRGIIGTSGTIEIPWEFILRT